MASLARCWYTGCPLLASSRSLAAPRNQRRALFAISTSGLSSTIRGIRLPLFAPLRYIVGTTCSGVKFFLTISGVTLTLLCMNPSILSVESGIPIPPRRRGRPKYKWDSMRIDSSFFVRRGKLSTVSSAASRAGKRLERTFSCRAVPGGIRVWRTT